MIGSWCYQEWWLNWTCWAFGWDYKDGRGWESDLVTVYFGPVRWEFMR